MPITLLCRLWATLSHPITCRLLNWTIPGGLLCFGVEAVFWNFAKKLEDHKIALSLMFLQCSVLVVREKEKI